MLEIFVSEASDYPDALFFAVQGNRWQVDPVEGIVLHHGIVGHIAENQPIARLQRFFEGIVPYDIAGKAGIASEPVCKLKFTRFPRANDLRSVWHLEHVRHMAGS